MARGLFREGNYAQVSFEGKASIPVRRDRYEHAQYRPPFHSLPTQEDYLAAHGTLDPVEEDDASRPG